MAAESCSQKVKTTRINRKAAGKSQATAIYEQRVMKHMSNRMQQKATYVDSPPFIIGFHDRVHQDMCVAALRVSVCTVGMPIGIDPTSRLPRCCPHQEI